MAREHSKTVDPTETEQKVIHLMLKSRECIHEMLDGHYVPEYFQPNHKPLVEAIYQEFLSSNHKRLLTRTAYRQWLIEQKNKDVILLLCVFDKCFIKAFARPDDLGYLKKHLTESFVARNSDMFLKDYGSDIKSGGYFLAAQNLCDKLQSCLGVVNSRRVTFSSFETIKDKYIGQLEERINNDDVTIRCGIPEIDDSINVGFKPMHLTLFVGDVGGFKTTMMLNVALNIYDKGYSILYVQLEDDEISTMDRIISNRLNIDMNKLAHPKLLTDQELEKIKEAKLWMESQHKFCILDTDERTSVSLLKREIEKRVFSFRPQVVVIDYVGVMQTDVRFAQRNDLEIGEILKSLRFLGKKHGFHIITAAQMGRAAIRALREGKEEAIDSTAIHGSHQYSADSDTIFVLTRVTGEPDKINVWNIKARRGPSGTRKELRVEPQFCRIYSTTGTQLLGTYNGTELDLQLNETPEAITKVLESASRNVEFNDCLDDDVSNLGA